MSERLSTCINDLKCVLNPFYIFDRIKDPFESSSGIDVNQFQYRAKKYEQFSKYNNIITGRNSIYRRNSNDTRIKIIIILFLILIIKILNHQHFFSVQYYT